MKALNDGKTLELIIDGEIYRQTEILEAIAAQNYSEIIIKSNSFGGDFLFARDVFFALKQSPVKKTAIIETAASSAALIISAADEIIMNEASLIMIHGVTINTDLNEHNFIQLGGNIQAFNDSIALIYSNATNGKTSPQAFRELMKDEAILTFKEMEKLGFPVVYSEKLSLSNKFTFLNLNGNAQVTNNTLRNKILLKRFFNEVLKK